MVDKLMIPSLIKMAWTLTSQMDEKNFLKIVILTPFYETFILPKLSVLEVVTIYIFQKVWTLPSRVWTPGLTKISYLNWTAKK